MQMLNSPVQFTMPTLSNHQSTAEAIENFISLVLMMTERQRVGFLEITRGITIHCEGDMNLYGNPSHRDILLKTPKVSRINQSD